MKERPPSGWSAKEALENRSDASRGPLHARRALVDPANKTLNRLPAIPLK